MLLLVMMAMVMMTWFWCCVWESGNDPRHENAQVYFGTSIVVDTFRIIAVPHHHHHHHHHHPKFLLSFRLLVSSPLPPRLELPPPSPNQGMVT